jgi:SAM-dependent methyltransferase
LEEVRLNLGCGGCVTNGFINVDRYVDFRSEHVKWYPDGIAVNGDMLELPFRSGSADVVECIAAIEHLPLHCVETAVKEMWRVLKVGAKVIIFTTDFSGLCTQWLQMEQQFRHEMAFSVMAQSFYGSQVHRGEFHYSPFTAASLAILLYNCNFSLVKMERHATGETWPESIKSLPYPPLGYRLLYPMITATAIKKGA